MAKGLLTAIIAWFLLGFSTSQASDRESFNLKGSLRTVVTESSSYSRQAGKWTEGPRHLVGCASFTPEGESIQDIVFEADGRKKFFAFKDGKMTGALIYNQDGVLENREDYLLNEKGTAQARVRYDASGSITEKEVPIYDQLGQPVEIDTYGENGRLITKTTNSYSQDGRLIERNMFKGDGSRILREVSDADLTHGGASRTENADGSVTITGARTSKPEGFEVQMTSYNADGSLRGKLVALYEQKGENIENASYGPDGLLVSKTRTDKEYDSHGNVIKRTMLRWVTSGGQSYFEPFYVLYITLTYY